MRAAGLILVGLLLGAFAAIVSTQRIVIAGTTVPIGLVITLGALGLMARAAAWWVRGRWGAAVIGLGWLAATVFMGTKTSNGDLVLADGTTAVVYLVAGTLLVSFCATFPLICSDDAPSPPRVAQFSQELELVEDLPSQPAAIPPTIDL